VNRFFVATVIVGVDPHRINFFSAPAVRQPHKGGVLERSKTMKEEGSNVSDSIQTSRRL